MQVDGGINAYTGNEVALLLGTTERDAAELCRGVHHNRWRYRGNGFLATGGIDFIAILVEKRDRRFSLVFMANGGPRGTAMLQKTHLDQAAVQWRTAHAGKRAAVRRSRVSVIHSR
jgi:hypothetical protein